LSGFELNPIYPAEDKRLNKGVFIGLLNAGNGPPHLLAIAGGLVYSLSVKGQHIDEPLSHWLAIIRRKKIPTLFIEWRVPAAYPITGVQNLFRKSTKRYRRVTVNATWRQP
jgi:hypothetical protein